MLQQTRMSDPQEIFVFVFFWQWYNFVFVFLGLYPYPQRLETCHLSPMRVCGLESTWGLCESLSIFLYSNSVSLQKKFYSAVSWGFVGSRIRGLEHTWGLCVSGCSFAVGSVRVSLSFSKAILFPYKSSSILQSHEGSWAREYVVLWLRRSLFELVLVWKWCFYWKLIMGIPGMRAFFFIYDGKPCLQWALGPFPCTRSLHKQFWSAVAWGFVGSRRVSVLQCVAVCCSAL